MIKQKRFKGGGTNVCVCFTEEAGIPGHSYIAVCVCTGIRMCICVCGVCVCLWRCVCVLVKTY